MEQDQSNKVEEDQAQWETHSYDRGQNALIKDMVMDMDN